MTKMIDFEGLTSWLLSQPKIPRTILAIAGAPGSGKSTLAANLTDAVNNVSAGRAAVLSMDGFHYDDQLLADLGRLKHKGAADTFDVGGLRHLLFRLRENAEQDIAVPVFDREIEIARAGGKLIPGAADIVVVEGNYLLLDAHPWNTLAPLFDATVMIICSRERLRTRLVKRWKDMGLAPHDIQRKVDENDLPNGRTVIEKSFPASFDYSIA